jgi:hypothetical protein
MQWKQASLVAENGENIPKKVSPDIQIIYTRRRRHDYFGASANVVGSDALNVQQKFIPRRTAVSSLERRLENFSRNSVHRNPHRHGH